MYKKNRISTTNPNKKSFNFVLVEYSNQIGITFIKKLIIKYKNRLVLNTGDILYRNLTNINIKMFTINERINHSLGLYGII